MNKPTPTKLVLLMSAAGLGLSWSGAALASREGDAPPGLTLPTSPALRDEKSCNLGTSDGWVSCSLPEGDLQQTIVVAAASVPLPLAPMSSSADQEDALRREAESSGQIVDGAPSAGAADALAWVAMDDPRQLRASPGAVPASSGRAAPAQALSPAAAESKAKADADRPQTLARRAVRADLPPNLPSAAPTVVAGARPAQAADRSVDTPGSAAAGGLSASEWAAVDRVWASLVEVVGSQLEDPPAVAAAPARQAGAPTAVAIVVPVERPQQASPASADGGQRVARSAEADGIVVSSHNDKVLMSLAALRADKVSDAGNEQATPAENAGRTVVARHTDKVLQTLALFQCRRAEQVNGCTAEPEGELLAALSADTWEPFEPAPQSAVASLGLGLGQELDIDLDRLALLAAQPDRPAHAEPASSAPTKERDVLGGHVVALSSDKLDEVRGGFVTDGGLKISFGIERAVYLNGSLVTTTSLNIADLSKIAGGQAQVTANGAGSLGLVQSGTGNVFAPGSFSSTAAGTIIQNTLDNQKIKTITTIDAVVNSSGILRAINLQSSMRSAIVDSLRR